MQCLELECETYARTDDELSAYFYIHKCTSHDQMLFIHHLCMLPIMLQNWSSTKLCHQNRP